MKKKLEPESIYKIRQRRKRLIAQACDYEQEIEYAEFQLRNTLEEIKELNPTRVELKEGLQNLFDEYI